MPYSYRKSERLRKNAEFLAAMKGKRLSFDGLSLFYRNNGSTNYRIGISVGKKVGNAVTRNRVRRRLRACLGTALGGSAAGFDLVIVARHELVNKEYPQVLAIVTSALQRSGVVASRSEGGAS